MLHWQLLEPMPVRNSLQIAAQIPTGPSQPTRLPRLRHPRRHKCCNAVGRAAAHQAALRQACPRGCLRSYRRHRRAGRHHSQRQQARKGLHARGGRGRAVRIERNPVPRRLVAVLMSGYAVVSGCSDASWQAGSTWASRPAAWLLAYQRTGMHPHPPAQPQPPPHLLCKPLWVALLGGVKPQLERVVVVRHPPLPMQQPRHPVGLVRKRGAAPRRRRRLPRPLPVPGQHLTEGGGAGGGGVVGRRQRLGPRHRLLRLGLVVHAGRGQHLAGVAVYEEGGGGGAVDGDTGSLGALLGWQGL